MIPACIVQALDGFLADGGDGVRRPIAQEELADRFQGHVKVGYVSNLNGVISGYLEVGALNFHLIQREFLVGAF